MPNNIILKYIKKKLTKLKREIGKFIIIVENFNIFLLMTYRKSSHKNQYEEVTITTLDLLRIYRRLQNTPNF